MQGENKGLQGLTRVFKGLQGFTSVYQGLQGFTSVYRGLQGFTRVNRDLQVYTRVFRVNKRKTLGQNNNTTELESVRNLMQLSVSLGVG